ncbi:MAG: ribosome biogenesis GTPase Der [Holosporales bacterium]|nr:ribosome biogenesis GTPase Der [Holosporales bacterium]
MNRDKIVIAGRTNVGKSTLFNRLTHGREAVVFNRPGVTRDLREREAEILNKRATIVDTPGLFDALSLGGHPNLTRFVRTEIERVIDESSLVLLVLDGTSSGIMSNDREIAQLVRKSGKPVIIVVNKADCRGTDAVYSEATELGFERVVKVSAEHGEGIDVLLESICDFIPDMEATESTDAGEPADPAMKLAIVGRPNTGKSAIVNSIVGECRRLVGDFAGLTRESTELEFRFKGRLIKIIDTPGLRRKSKIADTLEMIVDSNGRNAYRNADAVILVIDASSLICGEIESYDLKIAADIVKEGKALVIAFNKCDITPFKPHDTPAFLQRNFKTSFAQLKEVPFLLVSALRRININKMLKLTLLAYDKHSQKVKTSDLNSWLRCMCQGGGLQSCAARFSLKYITQVGTTPPTFLIFVSNKSSMQENQKRFIANSLRSHFGLKDVPIRIIFRDRRRSGDGTVRQ